MPGPTLHWVDVLDRSQVRSIEHDRVCHLAARMHVRPRVLLRWLVRGNPRHWVTA